MILERCEICDVYKDKTSEYVIIQLFKSEVETNENSVYSFFSQYPEVSLENVILLKIGAIK